jgi:hypothetical protein
MVTAYTLPVIYSDTINLCFAHALYVLKLLERRGSIILGLIQS